MDEHGPLIKETILLEEPILYFHDSGRKSTHQPGQVLDSITQKTQDDTSIEAILARSRHKDLIERVWEWTPMGHRERDGFKSQWIFAKMRSVYVFKPFHMDQPCHSMVIWGVFRPEQKNPAFIVGHGMTRFFRVGSLATQKLVESWSTLLGFARWVLKHFGTCHRKIPMSFDVRFRMVHKTGRVGSTSFFSGAGSWKTFI